MREAIKKVIFWNYGRTSWQYDVICLLVLAFIFLTPASWFTGKERAQLETPKVTRLIIGAEVFQAAQDSEARLQRVRELSGNPAANIAAWREQKSADGKVISYEIDVR